jgi:hypothetical protein
LIPVDSSVWIDCFKGVVTAQTEKLDRLLGHEPLAVGDLMNDVLAVELGGREIAIQAARNVRALRNLRVTVPKTVDTIIATGCIASGYYLLHNDLDFGPFGTHLGQRRCRLRITEVSNA